MEKHFRFKCYEGLPTTEMFGINNGKRLPLLSKMGGVKRIVDRKIIDVCGSLGNYGMGGPGFFGFKLEKKKRIPEEWFVITIWGADQWLLLDHKWLDCHHSFHDSEKCYFPESEGFFHKKEQRLQETFVGFSIIEFKLYNRSFNMILENRNPMNNLKIPESVSTGQVHILTFPADLKRLPPYGNGTKRKWHGEKLDQGLLISFTDHINI